MPSMIRRMRTRLPTYLSTGLGALVDISDTPWEYARAGSKKGKWSMPQALVASNPARRAGEEGQLSNELPDMFLDNRVRMRMAPPLCQPRGFCVPIGLPADQSRHEYAGVSSYASRRGAE